MFVYQGHFVAFEWQSPHAFMKRRRVCGESHDGSFVAAGLAWLRPYGHDLDHDEQTRPKRPRSVATSAGACPEPPCSRSSWSQRSARARRADIREPVRGCGELRRRLCRGRTPRSSRRSAASACGRLTASAPTSRPCSSR